MSQMDSSSEDRTEQDASQPGADQSHTKQMYWRFAAMIATSMVAMYFSMFIGSWEWSHVRWSQSRLFMALTMGGIMGLIMLAWMLKMYQNTRANVVIVVASVLLFAGGATLDRTQATVGDAAFMNAMIPHHSLAITRSERAKIQDVRVCELAYKISQAQRQEIFEMEWLIKDIQDNGIATTPEQAAARAVPAHEEAPERTCPAR